MLSLSPKITYKHIHVSYGRKNERATLIQIALAALVPLLFGVLYHVTRSPRDQEVKRKRVASLLHRTRKHYMDVG